MSVNRFDIKPGDAVTFGRTNGATAYGVVERVNPKTAAVRLVKQFNSNPPGSMFRVPFSLLNLDKSGTIDTSPPPYPVGLRIVAVRAATDSDLAAHGFEDSNWDRPPVLVLSDGSTLIPAQDYEGNGTGALFGSDARTGESFTLCVAADAKEVQL